MGIDPGTLIAGFAVVEGRKPLPIHPRDFTIIEAGVLRTPKSLNAWERIGMMHQSMHELLVEFQPRVCVLENVFSGKNVVSAITLGQARGAFIAAACRSNILIEEMASTSVKKIISGNGHAGKEDVLLALHALMGFDKGKLPYDASDALAIALSFGLSKAWGSK
jgi:crossover junction endodeoxyribonuclease RuvC